MRKTALELACLDFVENVAPKSKISSLNLFLLWLSHQGRFRALNVYLVQAAFGSSRPGPVHASYVSARCPNRPREEYHAAQHFSICSFPCIHLVFTRFTHLAGTR